MGRYGELVGLLSVSKLRWTPEPRRCRRICVWHNLSVDLFAESSTPWKSAYIFAITPHTISGYDDMTMRAAHSLSGKIDETWKIVRQIMPHATATGSSFSVGYLVQNASGKEAFLKAIDLSKAHGATDPSKVIEELLSAFHYERDLLLKCRDYKLTRVCTPLGSGVAYANGFAKLDGMVPFIIFDLSPGDVRKHRAELDAIDLGWCLRSLHDVAVAMQQLHNRQIVHQDLKPSNVLYFEDERFKVGDFGRAYEEGTTPEHKDYRIAGDPSYAPIDLYYSDFGPMTFERRQMTDLYLFGSMFYFFFSGTSALQSLRANLPGHHRPNTAQPFSADLPYLVEAFERSLETLQRDVAVYSTKHADEIVSLVRQLCEPDPRRRGDQRGYPTSLQRCVSRLNFLENLATSRFK